MELLTSRRCAGLQFHPEVTHTPQGKQLLGNFVLNVCGCKADWTMESFIEREVKRIQQVCGPNAHVIGAVSGGVDSTVAAALLSRAIGDRFHAILVDNGVLRLNEAEEAAHKLREQLKVNLTVVDASDRFLGRLAGVRCVRGRSGLVTGEGKLRKDPSLL